MLKYNLAVWVAVLVTITKLRKDLHTEVLTKSKTKSLHYDRFSKQGYLSQYKFKDACTIFKLRSRSIDCRANRKSTADNLLCRLCGLEEESQTHIVNCPKVSNEPVIDVSVLDYEIPPNDDVVLTICSRVERFLKLVNELDKSVGDTVDRDM